MGREILDGLHGIFGCAGPVIVYPASGTGAWEAALVNTLSAGDRVLMYETGWFATLWRELAGKLGLDADFVSGDWRHGADAAVIEAHLRDDRGHAIKAVCVVHNETSTGVTSRRSEEHTSELQSLMRISYAVFCLKKKKKNRNEKTQNRQTTKTTNNTRIQLDK